MTKRELMNEVRNLKSENYKLESDISNLKQLLEAELQAKENGCHRGNYCSTCKNAVLVCLGGKTTCYCTYGQCEHFEKETHYYEF